MKLLIKLKNESEKIMELTIVYDNVVHENKKGLKSDWGFSCYIQDNDNRILFDTGTKEKILLNNMELLNIDPKKIEKIVISHEHYDHNGGLKTFIAYDNKIDLYRLSNENPENRFNLKNADSPQKITDNIFTTGKIKGFVDEQSLILKGKKGIYILVGCSHPGIDNILNPSKEYGKIVGIIGGFHGFNDFKILKGLDLICPCHCTQYIKEIKNIYLDAYMEGGVGKIINI